MKNLKKKKTRKINKRQTYVKQKGGNFFRLFKSTLSFTSESIIYIIFSGNVIPVDIIYKVRETISKIINTISEDPSKTPNLSKLQIILEGINPYADHESKKFIEWLLKYLKIYNSSDVYFYVVFVIIVLLVIVLAMFSLYPLTSKQQKKSNKSNKSKKSPISKEKILPISEEIKLLNKSAEEKYREITDKEIYTLKEENEKFKAMLAKVGLLSEETSSTPSDLLEADVG